MLNLEHQKFLDENIFTGHNKTKFQRLLELHDIKTGLLHFIEKNRPIMPYTVEFSGTARSGKTSCIQTVQDFFYRGGFNVVLIDEIANKVNQRINDYNKLKNMSKEDYNDLVADETLNIFREKSSDSSADIILIDRGILDRYVWYMSLYERKLVSYEKLQLFYEKIKTELVDFLALIICDPLTSMKRDYLNSITLERRNNTDADTLTSYNNAVEESMTVLKKHSTAIHVLKTDEMTEEEVQINIASKILDGYQYAKKKPQ